jgi:hypothetical protein
VTLPRILLLLCAAAPFAAAQVHFHFGADAGVPLTDTLTSSTSGSISTNGSISSTVSSYDRYNSVTKRLIAGPVLRMDFGSSFGFEFDALYQRVDYDHANSTTQPGYTSSSFEATTGNRWQFPLLIQYTKKRMFVEGGLSISHIGDGQTKFSTSSSSNGLPSSSSSSYASSTNTQPGVVAGAGFDLPFLHGHLRPEIRYTHWLTQNNTGSGVVYAVLSATLLSTPVPSQIGSGYHTRADEVAFLAGWTF